MPPSLLPGPQGENGNLESGNLMNFSFKELKTATRNFSPDFVLGEGGFGKVFKGWIDTDTLSATRPGGGIPMAVKVLNNEGFQGHEEWLVSYAWNIQPCEYLDLLFCDSYFRCSRGFYP